MVALPPLLPEHALENVMVGAFNRARDIGTARRQAAEIVDFVGLGPRRDVPARNRGVSLLIIEHVMRAILTLSHRLVVLHHGEKIADGAAAAVARDPRAVEAYLGEGTGERRT
jgi:Branched-chain amino acid ATP-binding cassette transporter